MYIKNIFFLLSCLVTFSALAMEHDKAIYFCDGDDVSQLFFELQHNKCIVMDKDYGDKKKQSNEKIKKLQTLMQTELEQVVPKDAINDLQRPHLLQLLAALVQCACTENNAAQCKTALDDGCSIFGDLSISFNSWYIPIVRECVLGLRNPLIGKTLIANLVYQYGEARGEELVSFLDTYSTKRLDNTLAWTKDQQKIWIKAWGSCFSSELHKPLRLLVYGFYFTEKQKLESINKIIHLFNKNYLLAPEEVIRLYKKHLTDFPKDRLPALKALYEATPQLADHLNYIGDCFPVYTNASNGVKNTENTIQKQDNPQSVEQLTSVSSNASSTITNVGSSPTHFIHSLSVNHWVVRVGIIGCALAMGVWYYKKYVKKSKRMPDGGIGTKDTKEPIVVDQSNVMVVK